jgi:Bacterial transglutaminase-like N-terminal region
MAVLGEIRHTTTYKYAKPVTFGTHRAMFCASSQLVCKNQSGLED